MDIEYECISRTHTNTHLSSGMLWSLKTQEKILLVYIFIMYKSIPFWKHVFIYLLILYLSLVRLMTLPLWFGYGIIWRLFMCRIHPISFQRHKRCSPLLGMVCEWLWLLNFKWRTHGDEDWPQRAKTKSILILSICSSPPTPLHSIRTRYQLSEFQLRNEGDDGAMPMVIFSI